MKKTLAERLYWTLVALIAVGWVSGLGALAALLFLDGGPSALGYAAWLGVWTFPGFTLLLVPGLLFSVILESREMGRLVWYATIAVYIISVAGTALWFGLSRRASLRLRATILAVLIVAGPIGLWASVPLAGPVVGFMIFGQGITGQSYYEWKEAQDAAEAGKNPPPARRPSPVR